MSSSCESSTSKAVSRSGSLSGSSSYGLTYYPAPPRRISPRPSFPGIDLYDSDLSDDDDELEDKSCWGQTKAIGNEVAEGLLYQVLNWYTRLALFIGYLLIFLLTLILLLSAGYFDLTTWS